MPARKVYAVTIANYERKKKRTESVKRKRWSGGEEPATINLQLLEEIGEKVEKLTARNTDTLLLHRCIKEAFKCCICRKVARPLTVSGCCQRPLGCNSCVQQWFQDNERCPACQNGEGREKYFVLKGIDDFSALISKLDDPE